MANATYTSGQVTVTTTAAVLLTVPSACGGAGLLITNGSGGIVYLGGQGVTSSNGYAIPVSTTITIPTNGSEAHDLWAVGAASSLVSFLYAAP